jgi:glycerate-2-kinase
VGGTRNVDRHPNHAGELAKALVTNEATAIPEACGDAMVTGLTQTNANDLVLILIR